MVIGSSGHHVEIFTFRITEFSHSFQKLANVCCAGLRLQRRPRQPSNERSPSGRLRQYSLRPRDRRAAEQRDELAAFHSITSSARAMSVGGSSMPRALAVFALMISSNRVGCSIGKSDGRDPFRILSTKVAARRFASNRLVPYDISPPASANSRKPYSVGSRKRSPLV